MIPKSYWPMWVMACAAVGWLLLFVVVSRAHAWEVPPDATPVVAYPDASWQSQITAQSTAVAILVDIAASQATVTAAQATQVAIPAATSTPLATPTTGPTPDATQVIASGTATAIAAAIAVQQPYAQSQLGFYALVIGTVLVFLVALLLVVSWWKR